MDFIKIKITQGAIDNAYISVTEHLNFFPKESLGGKNKTSIGKELKFDLGFEIILSDIDSKKKNLRTRRKEFFSRNMIKENDFIIITKINKYEYKIRPIS